MAAKRIRWECPYGEHPGALGSTRPPRDAIVRYCIPCSLKAGKLVPRVAPALERKRAAGAARSVSKQQAKRERESLAKIDAMSAPVLIDGKLKLVRIDHMLERAWGLPTRKIEAPREPMPGLTVRRGSKPHTSGHCWYGGRIVITVGRVDLAEAVAVVLHEAAHSITDASGRRPMSDHHGRLFRSILRNLVGEWSGVTVPDPGGTDHEFQRAMAQHLREHPDD